MDLASSRLPQSPIEVAYEEGLVIEVRNRFDGSWSHGFEILEISAINATTRHYRLRRLSDGYVLPPVFSADDIVVNRT